MFTKLFLIKNDGAIIAIAWTVVCKRALKNNGRFWCVEGRFVGL
jgi:hypothetical protein